MNCAMMHGSTNVKWYMKYIAFHIFTSIFNELGQISVPKFQVCFDFTCILLFIVC